MDDANRRRFLPLLVDELAQTNPYHVWASLPLSFDPENGFRDISMCQLANGVNRLAWFMDVRLSFRRTEKFPTILYAGAPDIRHLITLLAAMKTGHKVQSYL
jgi:hypothetical protein